MLDSYLSSRSMSSNKDIVVSGVRPTGNLHLGNYFGAIQQYVDLQDQAAEAYYFIANLHALNTVRDRDLLRQYTLNGAIDLLALGLKPEKAVLFVQSDVPEVSELCWLLLTGTPMGLLERCVSCHRPAATTGALSGGLGGYVCPTCAPGVADARRVSPATLRLLARASTLQWGAAERLFLSDEQQRELRQVLHDLLRGHVRKEVKSYRFL